MVLCHDASIAPQAKLTTTIHQQTFVDLTIKDSAKAAVCDIKDDKFWKCIYILLCAVFPALRLLHYCDKNKPAMYKIFFLSHRTTVALDKLEEFLNDKTRALKSDDNLTREGNIVLGGDRDADNGSNNDSVIFNEANPPHLRTTAMWQRMSSMPMHPLNWT